MLTTSKKMLLSARKDGYAVGAFNATNLETMQAIIMAAQEMNSPAIVSFSKSAIEYVGLKNSYVIAKNLADKVTVPIALHLDHGPNVDLVKECVTAGYTSIMIDASAEVYKKNIEITKKAVLIAKSIPVEAELGKLKGVEDNVSSTKSTYTDPTQAKDFLKQTKAFSLAVAIGTSHGAYKFKRESKLDIKRLREIANVVSNPLVLHGASGVPKNILDLAQKYGAKLDGAKGVDNSQIKLAVKNGISKVNVDTDLRMSFLAGIRREIAEDPKTIDMRKYLGAGRELVKQTVCEKMKLFGSAGQAKI